MFQRVALASCLAAVLALSAAGQPAERFRLQDGDRVVFLGDGFVENEQFQGGLETRLLRHAAGLKLTFRNLGWSGDTVGGAARTSGYQNPEGMARLLKEVQAQKPTVLFVGYGMNESFAGPLGLPDFVRGLGKLLDELAPLKARVVLLSPTFHEDLGRPLPDPAPHNRNLEQYVASLRQLAGERRLAFVDLFHPLAAANRADPRRPLTSNGILLNEHGYWLAAAVVERELGLAADGWRLELDAAGKVLSARGAKADDVSAGPGKLRFRLADAALPAPPDPSPGGAAGEGSPVLRVTGLPAGMYTLKIDGREALTAPGADWEKGIRLGAGPALDGVEKLRRAVVHRNELFYRRWRPFNDHSRHWGFIGGDFKRYDDEVAAQERVIDQCRQPAPQVFELSAKGESR